MIKIDGAQGEGGGQVFRSALTLSLLTGQRFHITNIRQNRKAPGLRAQHLTAVDAARAISQAEVEGARLHSSELSFSPQEIRSGRYDFKIKTAGSSSLVLQTIFLPLSTARAASSVRISGGTHVPWAPCTHYLTHQWLPYMKILGFDARIVLDQAGFYPEGGGQISAVIRPINQIKPLFSVRRGRLIEIRGISAVANLPLEIAYRQKRQASKRFVDFCDHIHILTKSLPAHSKGTVLLLLGKFDTELEDQLAQVCYFSLGERKKRAESVADEAADDLQKFLEREAVFDEYLADQLLLPLSFASGNSTFTTPKITAHLLTNIDIISKFIPAGIEVNGMLGGPGRIHITPAELSKT